MRDIFILTAALAFLPLACQAHTHTADLQEIERKGHILSDRAQALIDQDPKPKDAMWCFKDDSGDILRIPQSGQIQQTGPSVYGNKSGNILSLLQDTK